MNPLRYRGYVYDTETGFYYLQSRYYDPAICRFLNADAFASTGQGILGNNMFAYCLNNPVNRLDVSGSISIWYFLVVDSDMGYIHRAVVDHIKDNYSYVRTEYSLSNFGRADIVHLEVHSVWEVKHAGIDPAKRAGIAFAQALTYVIFNEELSCLGASGAFEDTFYIQCLEYTYEVNYKTPLMGTVLYTVREVNQQSGNPYRVYVPSKVKEAAPAINSLAPVVASPHYALSPVLSASSAAFLLGFLVPAEAIFSESAYSIG